MWRRLSPFALVAAIVVSNAAVLNVAWADDGRARTLFDEGRAALAANRITEACSKFQLSYELDPLGPVLKRLAECNQLEGKLASAYARLVQLRKDAEEFGFDDQVAEADRLLAALEPRVPWLTVEIPADLEGATVTVDGKPLAPDDWNQPRRRNLGTVVVRVEAPDHLPFVESIKIEEGKKLTVSARPVPLGRLTVQVPAELKGDPSLVVTVNGVTWPSSRFGQAESVVAGKLVILATAPGRDPFRLVEELPRGQVRTIVVKLPESGVDALPPAPPDTADPWVPVGWTALGIGSAGLLTWAVAGGVALDRRGKIDPDTNCPNQVCTGDQTITDAQIDEANLAANVATVGLVVAGAAAVVGVVALVLGGDDDEVQEALSPSGLRIRF